MQNYPRTNGKAIVLLGLLALTIGTIGLASGLLTTLS